MNNGVKYFSGPTPSANGGDVERNCVYVSFS